MKHTAHPFSGSNERLRRGLRLLALATCLAIALAACGSADDGASHLEPAESSSNPKGAGSSSSELCQLGTARTCHQTLGRHGGVLSCYVGIQYCEQSGWGVCADGVVENRISSGPDWLPEDEAAEPEIGWKTISKQDCDNNPCDPSCKQFEDTGDGDDGYGVDGREFLYNWKQGKKSNLPGDVYQQAFDEPCEVGSDCQLNHRCDDPSSGSCSHDVCSTGEGLADGCSRCVTEVCKQKPQCCDYTKGYNGSCGHAPCETGSGLKSTCDPLVAKVCQDDKTCCPYTSTGNVCGWQHVSKPCKVTYNCLSYQPCMVDVACGTEPSTCSTTNWQYKCNWSYTWRWSWCNWSGCPRQWRYLCNWTPQVVFYPCTKIKYCKQPSQCVVYGPYCSYNTTCTSTEWQCKQVTTNHAGSWKSSCVTRYQQHGGTCGKGSWDSSCVAAVKDVCGADCKSPGPPTGVGECLPRSPGEKDSKCAGLSLAVGLSCEDYVPLCNHGQSEAPAGIRVAYWPKGAGEFGKAQPNMGQANYFTTSAAIAAGECINIATKDLPGLVDGSEIMINPPGNGHVAECYTGDNWGLQVNTLCGPPTCAGENIKAKIKPVNILITVDKSCSMGGTRWNNTKKAFQAFFKDPGSAGLNVSLEFWPTSSCGYSCSNSGINDCASPLIPLGKLTTASAPTDQQETKLVNAFNAYSPGGGTPALVALQGATRWASNYTATHPNEQQVVLFVTDGYPNNCGSSHGPFQTAAANAFTAGALVYAMNIVGGSANLGDAIAEAGGTVKGLMIDSNSQIEQKIIAAMQKIKGDTVTCDVALPGNIDQYEPEDAEVSYVPSQGGTPIKLNQVGNASACGKGWFFDNNTTPTKITLCPQTCTMVQSDPAAELDVGFGCPGAYKETTHLVDYEAACPVGTTVQWGYMAYNATTPSTSSARFDVRTAETKSQLAAASYKTVATAALYPNDTQVCAMSGPSPCPVDLYSQLGTLGAMNKPFLQLRIVNTPNKNKSKAPNVNEYNITYSCPSSE